MGLKKYQSEALHELHLQQFKENARLGILAFTMYTMPEYEINWHHREMAKVLNQFISGEIKRLMIFMPPRNGKPCYTESMILMKDGSRKKLGEIKIGDEVISHRGQPRKVTAVFDQGLLPTRKLRTETGRETIAALNHPFLTPYGWKEVKDLQVGDVLANVIAPETRPTTNRNLDEFIMAGYFIGDGHITDGFCRMTNMDSDLVADFTRAMANMGYITRRMPQNKYGYSFVGKDKKRNSTPLKWVREAGLVGNSRTKIIPEWVFRGDKQSISAFLGAYFSCDGSVNRRGGKRRDCCVEFYSVNLPLLKGTQHLLLRLGVRSRVSVKNGLDQNKNPHSSWRLTISSVDDVIEFRETIRVVGLKAKLLSQWPINRSRFKSQYFPDSIVAIEDSGLLPCRCLTVKNDHTFTVDDIVVHNSELVSRRLPAFLLGKYPDSSLITTSYSSDLASRMNRDVQRIMDSPEYQELFPETMLAGNPNATAPGKWLRTSDFFEVVGHKGGYRSAGVGGGITGMGGRFIVIDDPIKNQDEADSAVYREKIWSWYTSTLYTRLEKEGSILVTLTRWHEDDLAGRLLKEMKDNPQADQWKVICFPAVCEDTKNSLDPRQEGEALWPWKFPIETLNTIRHSVGSRVWNALYQQRPSALEGGLIKRSWLKFYKQLPVKINARLQSWDLSSKGTATSDFTVGGAWARSGGNYYLIDQVRGRMDFPAQISAIKTFSAKHPEIRKKVVEEKANGAAIIATLKNELSGLVPYNPDKSKESRVNAVAPFFEAGNVYLPDPSIAPWIHDYIEELVGFPNMTHDDQVDQTTQALLSFRDSSTDFLQKMTTL